MKMKTLVVFEIMSIKHVNILHTTQKKKKLYTDQHIQVSFWSPAFF